MRVIVDGIPDTLILAGEDDAGTATVAAKPRIAEVRIPE
jgi:hypothetical protein